MSEKPQKTGGRRSTGAIVLEFLGSMNLAITLLVVIAIASIIGTVLQQNEPYNNYILKFGPFWFDIFKALGLYDIYGAPWFLLLLGFLLVTTGVCVYRNTPAILRDMNHYRLDAREKSLRGFKHNAEWKSRETREQLLADAEKFLHGQGYRVRVKEEGDTTTLAAMKGSSSRLGYLLSHVAIVVICIGGLIDGNVPVKIGEYTGHIKPETRNIPVSEMPAESTLGVDNTAFRGSITIPEGSRANFVYLGLRDGYLLQYLPFTVELEDFRIEHYESGQPKSFESDLVIYDDDLDQPLRQTIAVNHPLAYKGYAIYQASFSDGGSELKMSAWSLDSPSRDALKIEGRVNEHVRLTTPRGDYTLELDDFKPFNIFPVEEDDPEGKKFRNFGSSFVFRLRAATGEAIEYVNYMSPVLIKGRYFFMSGMRTSQSEPYRFLHVPIDPNGKLDRFLSLRTKAMDVKLLEAAVDAQIATMANEEMESEAISTIRENIVGLVGMFVTGGMDAIMEQAVQAGPENQDQALQSYLRVIQGVLGALYIDVLTEEGIDLTEGVGEQEAQFFDDALNTFSMMGVYNSPVLLQLDEFNHIEASGLQITKSPGKDIVYLGCVMLMVGIFFMFYLHHRRLWLRVRSEDEGSSVLFAGSGHRDRTEFSREYTELENGLRSLSYGGDK